MAKLRAPGHQFVHSPLLEAAGKGDVGQVKSLLAQSANPDTRGPFGDTPMMLAVIGGTDSTKEVIELLAAAHATVDAPNHEGRTPLMAAALNYAHGTVDTLIRLGANPEHRDKNGKTALDILQERYDAAMKKERVFFAIGNVSPMIDRLKYWTEVRRLNDVLTPDILKPSLPVNPKVPSP